MYSETVSDNVNHVVEECDDPANPGLPRLELGKKPVSFFEFWPAWVFYIPIVIQWIFLSLRYRNFGLPMVVNPNIDLGGMVGESKLAILDNGGEVAKGYILPYIAGEFSRDESLEVCDESLALHVDNTLERAEQEGISFPFVVKPELGCRGAGVRLIETRLAFEEYLHAFPKDRRYIVQRLSPYIAEAGVFYERFPGDDKGRVTSITLKYRPYVIGDGVSTLRSLIVKDPRASVLRDLYFEKNLARLAMVPSEGEVVTLAFAGSHCRGSIFRDGNHYITPALSDGIDVLMRDFPMFHYGRLDIKFENLAALQRGENFVLIEVNGVSSEKTHIWDSRASFFGAFATLFEQYATLFKMGHEMRKQGHKVPSAKTLVSTWLNELKQSRGYPGNE